MTRRPACDIDFAAARDEGIAHLDGVVSNYEIDIGLPHEELVRRLDDRRKRVAGKKLCR